MIALLQRVTSASVSVKSQCIATINKGLLVLVGVEREDTPIKAKRLADRITGYRVFNDSDNKMNLCLLDIRGELLLVPQFTLVADTRKGTRASFSTAAPPGPGKELFDQLCAYVTKTGINVRTGQFGADMQVTLTNDGPVTFWLQT